MALRIRPAIVAALVWTLLIFVATSVPIPPGVMPEEGDSFFLNIPRDKVAHALLFGVFALLWGLALAHRRHGLAWVFGAGVALGALTEAIQAIPALRRMADWEDLIADVIGVALGLGVAAWITRSRRGGLPKADDQGRIRGRRAVEDSRDVVRV